MMSPIKFRALCSEDLPKFEQWQREPHVQAVWGNSQYSEPYEAYVFRTSSDSVRQYLILTEQNHPIGYIQYYWASRVGDGWWEGYDDQTVGIDFYLGDPQYLGKGLGGEILRGFLRLLFSNPHISRVIADPTPKNTKIIHILSQQGFRSHGEITTPDGPAVLMTIEKGQWEKNSAAR